MSDDGAHAIVVIAMLGNVFSSRYARARAQDRFADPLGFCTMNVALYGRGAAWSLTERGRGAVTMRPDALAIGPSSMAWEGDDLVVRIEERGAPIGGRVAGTVRVRPRVRTHEEIALDGEGAHRWRPLAPLADVEVKMDAPSLRWSGRGYVDSNDGDASLESAFDEWTWSRASLSGDRVAIAYRATLRGGRQIDASRMIAPSGRTSPMATTTWSALPATAWRLPRTAPLGASRLVRTLEDTPFYARSLVESRVAGERAIAVHETVSLRRFAAPWVQFLLPFRTRAELA